MVDMQLLNDGVTAIAIACGAAVFLAISVITVAAGLRQQAATAHSRAVAARRSVAASAAREPALR
jgi:hypothetical protein